MDSVLFNMKGASMALPDTPTVDEAFDAASEELTIEEEVTPEETPEEPSEAPSESTSEEEAEEQPKEEEAPEEEEKPEEESTEEPEETFAEKGELANKTPEELEETYKNWQGAYTQKRQVEKKEIADLKLENERLKGNAPEPSGYRPTKPIEKMSAQEYQIHVAEMAKEEVKVAGDNSYIDSQEKAFHQSDTRLDENSPTYDSILYDLVTLRLANARDAHEALSKPITEFNFVEVAKKEIAAFDERMSGNNKKYLKKQSEIARTKSKDFAKKTPKTSPAKTKKKNMTLDESIDSAVSG